MTDLPASFRAYVVDKPADGAFSRGLRDLTPADLPPGELTIRVEWSSVNFKDGLAARADGKVARVYPLVAGIDLAGEVVASDDDAFPVGSKVVANGYDIGTARHGGFGELARIPSDWAVPLPRGLTTRDAMAIGTAGFTAAMSVDALERHGLNPGDGPVLVTGAAGGVGSTAIAILAARGHEVWAATGKPDEIDRLRDLGATGFLTRDEVMRARPAARIGALGGRGRHGRLGDAALRAADAPPGRGGRVERQRVRRRAPHDGVPVHPARRRPAGDGQREPGDRAAPVAVGAPGRRPAAARHRRRDHRGRPRHPRAGAGRHRGRPGARPLGGPGRPDAT